MLHSTNMEIRNLAYTDFDTLFRGFENAFCDYAIHFSKEEVQSMLTRRGYAPELSFAAFDKDEIVAFTLNGIGDFRGVATAYDTGTGTVKEYRGRGLAGEIFNKSLPALKKAGIKQYLLEVLKDNHKAINIYRKMNFETTREFDCFRQDITLIKNQNSTGADIPVCVRTVDSSTVLGAMSFRDFEPSWQNSSESIKRGYAGLTGLGAFTNDTFVGYCVLDPQSGDIAQIAVSKEYRRMTIGSQLLSQAVTLMKTDFVKVLNVPADYLPLHHFLSHHNIDLSSIQFEMILPL